MTAYYFLRNDFEELARQILAIDGRIREIGHEMGASCEEGAETYHDNFAYEDGERQQYMWSTRLKELLSVKNLARIVASDPEPERVSIGCSVTVLDLDADAEKEFAIGSYMNYRDDVVSYAAPLARLLMGGTVGDCRVGTIAGKERHFEIISIGNSR